MEKLLHLSFTFENIQYHDVKVLYVLKVRTKKFSRHPKESYARGTESLGLLAEEHAKLQFMNCVPKIVSYVLTKFTKNNKERKE